MKKQLKSLYLNFLNVIKSSQLKSHISKTDQINIIVGASKTNYDNWFPTEYYFLDVTKETDFRKFFSNKKIKKVLAEHVIEHLSEDQTKKMINNFWKYSDSNINIRIAVPDGFHNDPEYIERVKPGGSGEGSHDHRILYNYKTLSQIFNNAGFKAHPIEYWDEFGNFHSEYKNDSCGYIKRCLINDDRNNNGEPNYTSLIIDFRKDN